MQPGQSSGPLFDHSNYTLSFSCLFNQLNCCCSCSCLELPLHKNKMKKKMKQRESHLTDWWTAWCTTFFSFSLLLLLLTSHFLPFKILPTSHSYLALYVLSPADKGDKIRKRKDRETKAKPNAIKLFKPAGSLI